MGAAPRWKVYSHDNKYLASCVFVEDAAALVACRGDGTTIRDGHRAIVWTEGHETIPAGESYDTVVDIVASRARYLR